MARFFVNDYDIQKETYFAKRSFGYTSAEPTTYEVMTGNEYLEFIANVYEMTENAFQSNKTFLLSKFGLSMVDMQKKNQCLFAWDETKNMFDGLITL